MEEPLQSSSFTSQSDLTNLDKQSAKGQVADKFAILYFMVVGGAAGIGWHCVVNCFDYFDAKYPGNEVSFIYPLAPYVAQMITTLVITQLSNYISYSNRIIGSLLILLALTIFMPFQADIFKETEFGMNMSMVLLFVMGFNNTLCYASVAGMTSKIDGKYTAYFLIGVAIFGLLMNLLREATLLVFVPESEDDIICILAYFGISAFIIFGALVLHGIFIRTDFYKINCNPRTDYVQIADASADLEVGLLDPNNAEKAKPKKGLKTMWEVFKATKFYMFLILVSCMQQNLVYPGVMLKKPMEGMAGHTKTVSMITTFSVFYILGKKLGQYRQYYNEVPVVVCLLLRLAFMAFFIIQAVTIDLAVFNTIWFGYVNVAMFAITMGFLNVSLFILSPEKVEGEKKEIAGFLAVFFINFGTMIGGFASLGLKDLGV